jgi:hypothetical protein
MAVPVPPGIVDRVVSRDLDPWAAATLLRQLD